MATDGLLDQGLKIRSLVLPDVFVDQGKPEQMYADYGLDAQGIVRTVFGALGREMSADDGVGAAGRGDAG